METVEWVALISAVAELIAVLIWPTVAVFFLIRFGPGLKKFFGSLSELTFKAGGIEAIAKKRQVEAAAALGAASAQPKQGVSAEAPQTPASPREIADFVASSVTAQNVRRLEDATVLWVDDIPSNNAYPRRALETLGIGFDLSLNTEDALEKTERRRYDAIISDMGRPPDAKAGYTLLKALREKGNVTPFIIYSSDGSLPEHRSEARSKGALGSTDSAQGLFELVITALTRR